MRGLQKKIKESNYHSTVGFYIIVSTDGARVQHRKKKKELWHEEHINYHYASVFY